jgi:predicted ATPase
VAGGYSFVHALYQQVLYQRVSAAQRVCLHQRIGARLEVGHGAQASDIAAELAMHFERGRDYQRAVHYLWQAGQRSYARAAYVEAISHLTKGLEVLKPLPDMPERTRLELALYTTLGGTLQVTKGWAAPEVEHAYAHARELCQQVGDTPQLAAVLGGLAGFYQNRGDLQTARDLGEQRLALVQRQQDVARLIGAHVLLQGVLYNMGEQLLARAHFEQTLALYDPQQHRFQAQSHPIVNCLSIAANVLHLLGYPEQSLTRLHEALTLARELAHPFTLAYAHFHAAYFHARGREGQAAQRHAEALVALASEHGFAQRLAQGTILLGYALALCGQGAEGIAHMRQGLVAGRATGAKTGEPFYLSLLVEGHRQEGQVDEGLRVVAEALAIVATTGNRSAEPELHRLKGELLLLQAASRQRAPTSLLVTSLEAEGGGVTSASSQYTEAEACFRHALQVARHQQAKFYELRTALSLSRLWQRQGKRVEARELLGPIYGWFTEGFDTADLQEARALLVALR